MKRINGRILVVDDEVEICEVLALMLKRAGLIPLAAYDGATALGTIKSEQPDLVMLDLVMPSMDGMEVLRRALSLDQDLPVVMITGHAELGGAVAAVKAGAYDYLAKPFEHDYVLRVVRAALTEHALKRKVRHLANELTRSVALRDTMGPSDVVTQLNAAVQKVAASDFSVMISGETGTGKELVARAIHQGSPRAKRPFVPVDCGAIPEALFESVLFGHEQGAFTGATSRHAGEFEAAQGGTLFLDEITNMPLDGQAKLMRVLQDKVIHRVGGTTPIRADVRMVTASNQDVRAAVTAGTFRQDLYFRLAEFTLGVPPLRDRKEDILYLAKRFLDLTNIELNKNVAGLSAPAVNALLAYVWPGNVRQLRSTIRRAVLLADDVIGEDHLDIEMNAVMAVLSLPKVDAGEGGSRSLKEIVRECTSVVERQVICQVLAMTAGNKAEAARLLSIDYKTMQTKAREYGISVKRGQRNGPEA